MRKILTNDKRDEIEVIENPSGIVIVQRWNYIGSINRVKSYSLAGEEVCYSDTIKPAINALANGEKFK